MTNKTTSVKLTEMKWQCIKRKVVMVTTVNIKYYKGGLSSMCWMMKGEIK